LQLRAWELEKRLVITGGRFGELYGGSP
jgi:hypothetical protein